MIQLDKPHYGNYILESIIINYHIIIIILTIIVIIIIGIPIPQVLLFLLDKQHG